MNVNVAGVVTVSNTVEGVKKVTLNRPPVNILSIDFMRELKRVLADPSTIADARILVLNAEGKAFCAGVDVADHTPERTEEMLFVFHGLIELLHELPVVTVAFAEGACLGGGMELACACDFVLASERAKFAVPEITLGVFPPVAMVDLPRLIGARKAAELIFSGNTLKAFEAERIGLVNAVYPVDQFETLAAEFTGRFSRLSRSSLIETKKAFRLACSTADASQSLKKVEERYLKNLMATKDAREGITAFMEKREPVWCHG